MRIMVVTLPLTTRPFPTCAIQVLPPVLCKLLIVIEGFLRLKNIEPQSARSLAASYFLSATDPEMG
jgi:hypothetical protein